MTDDETLEAKLDGYDEEPAEADVTTEEVETSEAETTPAEATTTATVTAHPMDALTPEQKDAAMRALYGQQPQTQQQPAEQSPNKGPTLDQQLEEIANLRITEPIEAEKRSLALAMTLMEAQYGNARREAEVPLVTSAVLKFDASVPEEAQAFIPAIARQFNLTANNMDEATAQLVADAAVTRARKAGKLTDQPIKQVVERKPVKTLSTTGAETSHATTEPRTNIPAADRAAFEKAFGVKVDQPFLNKHEIAS